MRLSIAFLCALPTGFSILVLPGTFITECHERHFWLSVKSSFLWPLVRFDVEDDSGVHFLSSRRAAECGYTMLFNHHGDLVFRASYLACYVDNKGESEFRLRVWFVNRKHDGTVSVYPFVLLCPLQKAWGPREITCEENYMEVSLKRQIPVVSAERVKWINMTSMNSEERAEQLGAGFVLFHRPGHAHDTPKPIKEAQSLGYHIVTTETRILLRCGYASPLSYSLKEEGIEVDVVSAVILLPYQGSVISLDASVACTTNEAVVDGTQMLWTFPLLLRPLVSGWLRLEGVQMGVDGRALMECVNRERGYSVRRRGRTMEIRVPFGAEGGRVRSRVVNGRYSQAVSVDLFYMQGWADAIWPLTQHRTYRLLNTPYVPRAPTLINNTVPSTELFSVILGTFPREVSLLNITVGGSSLSLTEVRNQGLHISQIPHSNGSHAYLLQVPFSHSLTTQKKIGGGYRRQSLLLTFTLHVSPYGEIYRYNATVVCDVKETAVSPWLEGKCTDRGILVLLHYGSGERAQELELYVGGRRLDWELVEMGRFMLAGDKDYFSVDMPLYNPSMTFEELTLQGLVAKVEVSVINVETLKVEDTLIQRCPFPSTELLVCLPEGRMVVVTDTTRSIPPARPNSTTLLDPACRPTATDGSRALFNFSLDSCGTTRKVEGNYLVYENKVRYVQELPTDDPLIHKDAPYRLTLQCRYPVNDTSTHTLPLTTHVALTVLPSPWKRTRRSKWKRPHLRPSFQGNERLACLLSSEHYSLNHLLSEFEEFLPVSA